MGMYTELVVTARIANDPKVVNILKYMLGDSKDEPKELPDHPLFAPEPNDTRWKFMLQCSSYYHLPRSVHLFEFDTIGSYWCLHSRSDFKDYSNESVMFFDWLKTILDDRGEEKIMLGYTRYEEDTEPIIYYTGI